MLSRIFGANKTAEVKPPLAPVAPPLPPGQDEDHVFVPLPNEEEQLPAAAIPLPGEGLSVAVSMGHGERIRGAKGILDEVVENRAVVMGVVDCLKKFGAKAVEFYDETSTTVAQNISAIVTWHKKQEADIDVAIHFNAFNGQAHGTEVIVKSDGNQDLANRVAVAMSMAGPFRLRPAQGDPIKAKLPGVALRDNLGFLNGLRARPSILIEVCFVDNANDAENYRKNKNEIHEAIAFALVEWWKGKGD